MRPNALLGMGASLELGTSQDVTTDESSPTAGSPPGRFPAAVLTVRGAPAPLNPPPPTPRTPGLHSTFNPVTVTVSARSAPSMRASWRPAPISSWRNASSWRTPRSRTNSASGRGISTSFEATGLALLLEPGEIAAGQEVVEGRRRQTHTPIIGATGQDLSPRTRAPGFQVLVALAAAPTRGG